MSANNENNETSPIGRAVEFPLDIAGHETGVIETYDEDSGAVTVKAEDGEVFNGYEYQLEYI
jgi:hypothetical protein